MKQAVSVTMVIGALLLVASSLQGCGCDKDSANKCITDNVYTTTGSDVCSGWDKLMKCIEDADCCDYEEDGTKIKDTYEGLQKQSAVLADCKKPC